MTDRDAAIVAVLSYPLTACVLFTLSPWSVNRVIFRVSAASIIVAVIVWMALL